jgi:hypothetical protein
VAVEGPVALITQQGPYDLLYQMIEGFLISAGIPGLALELFVPGILAASIPYLMSRLVTLHLDKRTAIFVALATPGWFAVYRLEADLHANLLALALFILAIAQLSQAKSLRDPRSILGVGLVGLASFAHIESIMFLVSITLVSSLVGRRIFPLRVIVASALAAVPAAAFYIAHISQVLVASGGTFQFSSPQSVESWLVQLGPLIPLSIIGLASSILGRGGWLERFATTWGLASVVVGLSQYVDPQTVIFAQRAVLLFPTPLLTGLGIRKLNELMTGRMTIRIPWRYVRQGTMAGIFIIIAVSWPVTTGSAVPDQKIFISSQEFQQLQWVSVNMKFSSTPLFVFNDRDEFAGGLAQLYDNWVSATVGPHFSYVGLVDYLVQLEETPYYDTISQTVSREFMQQIRNGGITTTSLLLQHPIIIVGDFYRPFPLPTYTAAVFTEVTPGIFAANATRLQTLANITLPLYVTFGPHLGAWYGKLASWTESNTAYEVYDPVPPTVQASFEIGVRASGTFTVSLRYWDASGNNLTIGMDGNQIGTIAYGNTQSPAIRSFPGVVLAQGVHSLTITVVNTPTPVRYASLDYLALSGP